MRKVTFPLMVSLVALLALRSAVAADPEPPQAYLRFNGTTNYVEIPNSADFSVTIEGLTVAAWMRPDALSFPKTEGSLPDQQFVHWLGKGRSGQHEWVFRMYSQPGPRENRISFYVFSSGPPPVRGCGSYFQDPLEAGEWIHVVGVVDNVAKMTQIYKNGILRNTNSYLNVITPQPGTAPLRMGTRDFASFFQGALAAVRIWNRPLSEGEVSVLYEFNAVPESTREALVAEYLLNDSRFVSGRSAAGYVAATWGSDSSPINSTSGRSGGGC